MGDPPFDPLGGQFADAILRFLQALADNADKIEGDWGITVHQLQQLGFTPACLQSFDDRNRVGGITPIGEQRHSAKHFTRGDEADHHLRPIAPRLRDSHTAFDDHMGVYAVVALAEDAPIFGQALNPSLAATDFRTESASP